MDYISEVIIDNCINEEKIEICRLCGKECIDFVAIFEENNLYIAEKISRCLPIIVLSSDNLTPYVCMQCVRYLNISYKLIVTSIKVDAMLREQYLEYREIKTKQLDNNQSNKLDSKYIKNLSLKELRKCAIVGPAPCDLCDKLFYDIDAFDNHMDSIHFFPWRCNLCDSSFETSVELISHKSIKHNGKIIICKTCVNSNDSDNMKNDNERITEEFKSNSPDFQLVETKNETPVIKQFSDYITNVSSSSKVNKKNQNFLLLCDICKIGFGDERHYNAHINIHLEKKMTCYTCQTDCTSIYDLYLHKRAKHNMYKKVQLKYVCDKCGKFFTNSWQWESHNGNACSKKLPDNRCKYCKSIFSTGHKLSRHLRKHKTEMLNDPNVTIYKCIACPKVFVDKEFYQQHRNVHDPECWDKYRCTICNRSFRDRMRLKEHKLSIHEGVKPHKCDTCDRTFYRLSNMKVHQATHFGHKCNNCNSVFDKVKNLINHVKQDHGLEPDSKLMSTKKSYKDSCYICRYCGKKLASYQSVINHEYIHTGEKPYKCAICHKAFRSYTARWAHVQRHKKGNFVCEHCGKCFNYKQNLTVHIQTHVPMEDRKHQCTNCGKKFLRKCQLNVHMRIHDGIRPYTCDICLFSFTQLGDMKRHRIRHMKGEVQLRNTKKQNSTNIDKSGNSD